jgi:hypothetical protein
MKRILVIFLCICLFGGLRPALLGEAYGVLAPFKTVFDPGTLILIGLTLLCVSIIGRQKERSKREEEHPSDSDRLL